MLHEDLQKVIAELHEATQALAAASQALREVAVINSKPLLIPIEGGKKCESPLLVDVTSD